eukprot:3895373-Amphidinium_carterae.1
MGKSENGEKLCASTLWLGGVSISLSHSDDHTEYDIPQICQEELMVHSSGCLFAQNFRNSAERSQGISINKKFVAIHLYALCAQMLSEHLGKRTALRRRSPQRGVSKMVPPKWTKEKEPERRWGGSFSRSVGAKERVGS